MKVKHYDVKKCDLCTSEFKINPRNKRSFNKRFCSPLCAKSWSGKNNKGRKHSVESSEKKRIASLGEKNHFFGKTHSDESLLKMSEASKWSEDKFSYCNLTNNEKEILDGLMLSDGCMSEKSRISSRLTFGFKYKETVERLFRDLPSMRFGPIWQSTHTLCYHSKSSMYADLLLENSRWYPIKEKIVPYDVQLTAKSCYWWFVGDGYSNKYNLYFATNAFSDDCVFTLIKKLDNIGFKCKKIGGNKIMMLSESSRRFLQWLSDTNEIQKEYLYKWKMINNG